MKLQQFIEENANKSFGSDFIYEKILICTRLTHPLEPWHVVVSIHIPGIDWHYADVLDDRTLDSSAGTMVGFYNWIKSVFLPVMKVQLIKKVKSLESKND
jgi:hypothetical protein